VVAIHSDIMYNMNITVQTASSRLMDDKFLWTKVLMDENLVF
jgi:hypothetical protein